MIIGIGYRKQSGKDTVAEYLVKNHGFKSTAFAKSLKSACAAIFHLDDSYWYGNGASKEIVHPFWKKSPRYILQHVGTEAMRKGYDYDIWVKSLEWEIMQDPGANWVISDVRFINEAEMVKRLGGVMWRTDRDAVTPKPPSWWRHPIKRFFGTWEHTSERQLKSYRGWDSIIVNNGTLEDLYRKVEEQLESARRR